MPGSPLDPCAARTNDLIKQGGMLTTGAFDVINAVDQLDHGMAACPALARPLAAGLPNSMRLSSHPHHRSALAHPRSWLDDLIRMAGAFAS